MVETTETLETGVSSVTLEFCPSVLIVGESLSALYTSLALADKGFQITVLNNSQNDNAKAPLGLSGAMVDFIESIETFGCDVPEEFLPNQPVKQLIERFDTCENIRFLPGAMPVRCTGQAGAFDVLLKTTNDDTTEKSQYEKIQVGAIVLADDKFQPTSLCAENFGLQPTTAITSFPGLMLNLRKGYIPRSIAIVMDLAAEQGRLTSSMVFTTARYLAQRGCQRIRIYCRNTRVSSPGLDTIYTSARSAGVEFSRHDRKISLAETPAGLIEIRSTDYELGREITGEFDMVIFADLVYKTGDECVRTSQVFETFATKPLPGQAGNIWLTPCKTNRLGLFALGMDGANCDFQALRTEAELAAFEIHQLLAEPKRDIIDDAAVIDPEKCVSCLTCLRLCPHGAIRFDEAEQAAEISKLACRRCGICVAECPANAITLPKFTDEQILAQVTDKKKVTVFACTNSAAVAAGLAGKQNFADVQIIEVPCAGKVDPRNILKTFEQGAENVLVLGCNPEACKYFDGPTRAQARLARLKETLKNVGFNPARLQWAALTANETDRFNKLIGESSQDSGFNRE